MLAGKPIESCQSCYNNEAVGKDSLRQGINRSMGRHVSKIELTDDTGRVEPFELNYFDSRFDNLCNLACRMCNAGYSSLWAKEVDAHPELKQFQKSFRTGTGK